MYIGVNNLCNNSNELPTPCYIFDEAEFGRGIDGFKEALLTRFADVAIGYSVKTNSLPYALRQARLHGCMAEVVSHDEYQLARLCGFEPREIIYNGPMKSRETFVEAIQGGAIVNLETKRELEWLAAMPAGRTYNVGIRLNINRMYRQRMPTAPTTTAASASAMKAVNLPMCWVPSGLCPVCVWPVCTYTVPPIGASLVSMSARWTMRPG